MSDASDKLARSRQAILAQIAQRQRRHDPREEFEGQRFAPGDDGREDEAPDPGGGWLGHLAYAVKTWWRYHPAHMVVDLASPLMREYARRKPTQMLAIAFGTGALLTFARPWKLISLTTVAVALLKSSQLSHLMTAAMSAADYRKDHNRPE
jgi:hypothetical protein